MAKELSLTPEDEKELSGTISHETNLMYLLARCIDTMAADIESRLNRINNPMRLKVGPDGKYSLKDKKGKFHIDSEARRRIKNYTKCINDASAQFRNFVEPCIMNSVQGDWKLFERTRILSNEMIRLLMMYYEVCNMNNKNHEKVFDLLMELSEVTRLGAFSADDINRFDLGCKK